MIRVAAPSTAYEVLQPREPSREASTVMMTSWPTALPETATLFASPRRRTNHLDIITLTVGIEVAAWPTA